jgi:hypothetical protein
MLHAIRGIAPPRFRILAKCAGFAVRTPTDRGASFFCELPGTPAGRKARNQIVPGGEAHEGSNLGRGNSKCRVAFRVYGARYPPLHENPRDVNRSAEDAASQSAQPVRRTHADHCGLR